MGTEVIDGPRVVGRVSERGQRLVAERNRLRDLFEAAETDEERDRLMVEINLVSERLGVVLAEDRVD